MTKSLEPVTELRVAHQVGTGKLKVNFRALNLQLVSSLEKMMRKGFGKPHLPFKCGVVEFFHALETGVMKSIFAEDVIGLTTHLRQDAPRLEAVTHRRLSQCLSDIAWP